MIRLMGFVTGAALAVGLMLYLFGLPRAPESARAADAPDDATMAAHNDSTPSASGPEAPAPDQASAVNESEAELVTESDRALPSDSAASTSTDQASAPTSPAASPASSTVPLATTSAATPIADAVDAADLRSPETTASDLAKPEDEVDIAVASDAPARELRWHAFWSPFKSRIAANGFVGRLEAVTGFDYRVVQIDTGVYEVAVGYASDDERRDKLAAIAEATGLEVPGS